VCDQEEWVRKRYMIKWKTNVFKVLDKNIKKDNTVKN
jgi:hypothetical protein